MQNTDHNHLLHIIRNPEKLSIPSQTIITLTKNFQLDIAEFDAYYTEIKNSFIKFKLLEQYLKDNGVTTCMLSVPPIKKAGNQIIVEGIVIFLSKTHLYLIDSGVKIRSSPYTIKAIDSDTLGVYIPLKHRLILSRSILFAGLIIWNKC